MKKEVVEMRSIYILGKMITKEIYGHILRKKMGYVFIVKRRCTKHPP